MHKVVEIAKNLHLKDWASNKPNRELKLNRKDKMKSEI